MQTRISILHPVCYLNSNSETELEFKRHSHLKSKWLTTLVLILLHHGQSSLSSQQAHGFSTTCCYKWVWPGLTLLHAQLNCRWSRLWLLIFNQPKAAASLVASSCPVTFRQNSHCIFKLSSKLPVARQCSFTSAVYKSEASQWDRKSFSNILCRTDCTRSNVMRIVINLLQCCQFFKEFLRQWQQLCQVSFVLFLHFNHICTTWCKVMLCFI